MCATDNLETGISHNDPTKGKGGESRNQGVLTDPQTSVHNNEDQCEKQECEEHKAEEPKDKPTKRDGGKKSDMGSSPKRSKKMKWIKLERITARGPAVCPVGRHTKGKRKEQGRSVYPTHIQN